MPVLPGNLGISVIQNVTLLLGLRHISYSCMQTVTGLLFCFVSEQFIHIFWSSYSTLLKNRNTWVDLPLCLPQLRQYLHEICSPGRVKEQVPVSVQQKSDDSGKKEFSVVVLHGISIGFASQHHWIKYIQTIGSRKYNSLSLTERPSTPTSMPSSTL